MIRRAPLCLMLALFAAGCSSRPEIVAQESPAVAQSGYPTLGSIDALLAESRAESAAVTAQSQLSSRAAGLRARAQALRQRQIDG